MTATALRATVAAATDLLQYKQTGLRRPTSLEERRTLTESPLASNRAGDGSRRRGDAARVGSLAGNGTLSDDSETRGRDSHDRSLTKVGASSGGPRTRVGATSDELRTGVEASSDRSRKKIVASSGGSQRRVRAPSEESPTRIGESNGGSQ